MLIQYKNKHKLILGSYIFGGFKTLLFIRCVLFYILTYDN